MNKFCKILPVILLLLLRLDLCAQTLHYPFTIPILQSPSLHSSFADALSITCNPSAASSRGMRAAIYAEKRYLVEGLNSIAAAICYSGSNSGYGFQFARTGNLYYQQVHFAVHYMQSLGIGNIAGIFRYNMYSLAGYQRSSFASAGIAMMWKLTDNLYSSIQVINPPLIKLSNKESEREAAEYHLGLSFKPSEVVSLNFETIKMQEYLLQVVAALLYKPSSKYLLKIGWSSTGPQPFLSIAWKWKSVRLGISVTYHPVLGISPGTLFQYEPIQSATP